MYNRIRLHVSLKFPSQPWNSHLISLGYLRRGTFRYWLHRTKTGSLLPKGRGIGNRVEGPGRSIFCNPASIPAAGPQVDHESCTALFWEPISVNFILFFHLADIDTSAGFTGSLVVLCLEIASAKGTRELLCLWKFSNYLMLKARPPRFERGTFCSGGQHSIQLSYGRKKSIQWEAENVKSWDWATSQDFVKNIPHPRNLRKDNVIPEEWPGSRRSIWGFCW